MSSDISRFPKTVEDKVHILGCNGIEPLLPAYQTGFLPLEEHPEPVTGIEPVSSVWKTDMLAVTPHGLNELSRLKKVPVFPKSLLAQG